MTTISGGSIPSTPTNYVGKVTTKFYPLANYETNPSLSVASTADQVRLVPFVLQEQQTLNNLVAAVGIASSSQGNFILGIYNSGVNKLPSTLIVTSSVGLSGGTGPALLNIPQTQLNPGLYWVAFLSDTNGATAQYRAYPTTSVYFSRTIGANASNEIFGSTNPQYLFYAGSYASGFPADLSGQTLTESFTAAFAVTYKPFSIP